MQEEEGGSARPRTLMAREMEPRVKEACSLASVSSRQGWRWRAVLGVGGDGLGSGHQLRPERTRVLPLVSHLRPGPRRRVWVPSAGAVALWSSCRSVVRASLCVRGGAAIAEQERVGLPRVTMVAGCLPCERSVATPPDLGDREHCVKYPPLMEQSHFSGRV